MKNRSDEIAHLARVRKLCRYALALGLVASLAANVVAADPSLIGRVVAGWPPLVLLIVVELVGRVSLHPGWLSRVRLAAASGIAGVAALVSYKHMLEVATMAGEGMIEAHLIPLTVDGLVIVASISLVGLNHRIAAAAPTSVPASKTTRPASTNSSGGDAADGPPVLTSVAAPSMAAGDAGDRIARYLAEHPGAKQSEIAKALGVSAKTVQRSAAWRQRLETAV